MFLFGCTLKKPCADTLFEVLESREDYGYDAMGITLREKDDFLCEKGPKRVFPMRVKLGENDAATGICHARWATCGACTMENAHPFFDNDICIAANGTINNAAKIRNMLGLSDFPDCDSAVLAPLLNKYIESGALSSIKPVLSELSGAFSFGMFLKNEDAIYAVNHGAPLYAGLGASGSYISSEIAPLFKRADKIFIIEEGETVQITPERITIFNNKMRKIKKAPQKVTLHRADGSSRDSSNTFNDMSLALEKTINRYISGGKIIIKDLKLHPSSIRRIYLCGCGSSYNLAFASSYNFEAITDLPTYAISSGEFCSGNTVCDKGTLFIAISRSGETAETIRALQMAKKEGAKTIAITEAPSSRLGRECKAALYTLLGDGTDKYGTKSINCMFLLLCIIALNLGIKLHSITDLFYQLAIKMINSLPDKIRLVQKSRYELSAFSSALMECEKLILVGQNTDLAAAAEGTLKMMQTAAVQALCTSATEFRYTTLSIVDEATAVVGLVSGKELLDKTLLSLNFAKIRGAKTYLIIPESLGQTLSGFDGILTYPDNIPMLNFTSEVTTLHLITEQIIKKKGMSGGKPNHILRYYTV